MSTRRGTTFSEVMEGTLRLKGARTVLPMRLELDAALPGVLLPWSDLKGTVTGRVAVPGWADDRAAAGRLLVAPLTARRIRYLVDFTSADGRRLHLDGWKSITAGRPLHSPTFLPVTITDEEGTVVGEARLRFHLRRDLARFLASFRFPRTPRVSPEAPGVPSSEPAPMRSRWRRQEGRLEVWYTTLTDPATGTGIWFHHELVASNTGEAQAHGWAAVFPPGEVPVLGRFGPYGWEDSGKPGFAAGPVEHTPGRLAGKAGDLSWDLTETGGGETLYTFPRWAWERELLPAAQIVPTPAATYDGAVRFGDRKLEVRGGRGGSARIYGHGNAERWAWLHADLGGGDVCEVVAAVSTRPLLNRLPALPFVRLRVGGEDWPSADPLRAAFRLRCEPALPTWTVHGRVGDRRVHIQVTQRPEETVAVDYADPDGRPAVCHNTERADVMITLSRRTPARGWHVEREWRLDGTGHAEVGLR